MLNNKYNITIEKYNPTLKQEWDSFVNASNNGTIFHLQSFLDYHEEGKFIFTNYLIRNNGKIVALLPGGYKENGNVYWSPLGASYGSLITVDIPFELALNIIDAVIEYFKKHGTKEIFMIPPPLIYNKIFNQNVEYAMLYRKFDFEYHYISHTVDLSNHDSKNYNGKIRYKIRKSQQNSLVKILQVNDFETFYPILLNNKLKHNSLPTHSINDLHKLDKLLPDKLKLFMMYYDGIPIGGNLVFLANQKVALCFYNMMDYNYTELSPAYSLTEHVINWSRENGYQWFDFGVSQDTTSENPMTPSLNLIQFKENFLTRGIFRSTYHLRIND